jgi:hypothetical protein
VLPAGLDRAGAPALPPMGTGRHPPPAQPKEASPCCCPSSPRLRAQFRSAEADRRDHQRAQARAGLADPQVAAACIALAICEVEAGYRPVQQLEQVCHHGLYQALLVRVRRSGGPAVTGQSLVDVHLQVQVLGLVHAVVLVRRGDRVAAIALELYATPGHWELVELQY